LFVLLLVKLDTYCSLCSFYIPKGITPANRNRVGRNFTGRQRVTWHVPPQTFGALRQTGAKWRRKKPHFANFFFGVCVWMHLRTYQFQKCSVEWYPEPPYGRATPPGPTLSTACGVRRYGATNTECHGPRY